MLFLPTMRVRPIAKLTHIWRRTIARASIALGLIGSPCPAHAAPSVERIAVLVAANDGGSERDVLRYAESDAHAMAKVLRQVGGLHTSNEIQVYRATIPRLHKAIERATNRAAAARKGNQRVELIFYYSGHSDDRGLLLGTQRLSYADLRAELDAIPADVRIAILDSCASGAFTRIKGGTRRPPFLVGSAGRVEGHAFLTSSSADETAQESDRIGGSFFTHFLVSGMRGGADRDGDKRVTLAEAYQFAYDETLEHTQVTSAGAQHAAYEIRLSGSGELVMTDLRHASARLELSGELRGRLWVRSQNGRLAAELAALGDGTPIILALEPGSYDVTLDANGRLQRASISLSKGEHTALDPGQLTRVPREKTTARGGTTDDDYLWVPVSVGLFPRLSVGGHGRPIIVNFGAALLWNQAARVHGISMAIGADIVREHVRGTQWTAGVGIIQGRLTGTQLTTGANWVTEDARGAQLSLLGNVAGRAYGAQLTTGLNWATMARGAQVGLTNVVTQQVHGAQIGLLNVGREIHGAQVGLVNIARRSTASVGLLSITREGGVHPEVWTSDVAAINVGVRFAAKYTYSFVAAGIHPAGRGAGWRFGGGFGGHLPLRGPAALELDLSGYATFVDLAFDASLANLAQARLLLAWSLRPRLTLWGGPTFALLHDDPRDGTPRLGYGWIVWQHTDTEGDDRLMLWPGFAAGLRF